MGHCSVMSLAYSSGCMRWHSEPLPRRCQASIGVPEGEAIEAGTTVGKGSVAMTKGKEKGETN